MAGDQERIGRLWDMIGTIKVAMLTTWDGEQLHSRPMVTHQEDAGEDLWFFTRLESGKVEDARHYDRVNLVYADPSRQQWVSVSGRAMVERDDATIDRFWTPTTAAWFPRGRDDSDIAMLRVVPETAEYWDVTDSRMRDLWEGGDASGMAQRPTVETQHVELAGGRGH